MKQKDWRTILLLVLAPVTITGCAATDETVEQVTSSASGIPAPSPVRGCTASDWNKRACDLILVSPFAGRLVPGTFQRTTERPGNHHPVAGVSPSGYEDGRVDRSTSGSSTLRLSLWDLHRAWRSVCPQNDGVLTAYDGVPECAVAIAYRDGTGAYPTGAVEIRLIAEPSSDTVMPELSALYMYQGYNPEYTPYFHWLTQAYTTYWSTPTPRAQKLREISMGYMNLYHVLRPDESTPLRSTTTQFGNDYPNWYPIFDP